MSFIRDFFKALANNPNVINDDELNAELNQFLQDNSESNKRVSFLERSMINSYESTNSKDNRQKIEKVAKDAVKKYKASNAGSSNKVEKSRESEEEVREIGE